MITLSRVFEMGMVKLRNTLHVLIMLNVTY